MDVSLFFDEFYLDYYLERKAVPVDIYEPPFSNIYSALTGYYEGEFNFFHKNILRSGERILEIAGGDGARYTIPLAVEGFQMTSLEYSESMVEICRERIAKYPKRVQKNIEIIHKDFWKYSISGEAFDGAILPATTLCLFGDTVERLVSFFTHVKGLIKPDGRFIFDFRIGPWIGGTTEPRTVFVQEEQINAKVTFREFFNRIPGYNVANFYCEIEKFGQTEGKFITASKKKAFARNDVYSALAVSGFEVTDTYICKNDIETIEIICCKIKPSNG